MRSARLLTPHGGYAARSHVQSWDVDVEPETPRHHPPPAAPRRPAVGPPGSSRRAGGCATGATWVLVFVAYSGVWKASRELGLATWWLGPVSEPQPIFVMLVPFVAPAAMVVATLNNVRRLPWYGLVASAVAVLIGIVDLGRVRRLGVVELAIAAAGALVSSPASAARYRRRRRRRRDAGS